MQELQEAEICDLGILMSYPRDSAESLGLASLPSRRRPAGKRHGAQNWADQTFDDEDITATRMGAGTADGIGGVVSIPAGTSAVASLGAVPVPVVPLSVQSDQASGGVENLIPDQGQTTAQRCEGEVRGQECVESVHGQPNVQSSETEGDRSEERGVGILTFAIRPGGRQTVAEEGQRCQKGANSPKFAKGQKLKRRAPVHIAAR